MATSPKIKSILDGLEAAAKLRVEKRISFFSPYEKQQEFFDMGAWARERLLMAGNQLGKSEAGAVEMAYHLTGDYPDDWLGYRFDHPVTAWAAGVSSEKVRNIQQTKLCGQYGLESALGTGYIPKSLFVGKPSMARGITDAFDTIHVRHKSGGTSTLSFKSYEQGREKFQGDTLHVLWLDEEPPMDIYSECLTRLTATQGILFMTFTPLLGMSDVVGRYLNEKSDDRGSVVMTINNVPLIHFMTPNERLKGEEVPAAVLTERRTKIIAGYPAHEREARANGVPMLGSGRIFPYADELISEPPLSYVPLHWVKIWGIDFGIGHPFAAVLLAWDRDNDIVHVLHAIRMVAKDGSITPINHAAAMKTIGGEVPVAWPADGNQRDKGSGDQLAEIYKKHGLKMRPTHATWPEGGISTEVGITTMEERIKTGKFKVAAHLSEWFEEFRFYHRKDGMIVKVKDDLLSGTRIGIMDLRHAKPVPLGAARLKAKGPQDNIAQHTDLTGDDLY